MKILCDLHTHTVASTHAFSTVLENAHAARDMGLELIAITDHGSSLPDSPHPYHFSALAKLPRELDGITVIPGLEANVCDYEGHLDMTEKYLRVVDLVIASIHEEIFTPATPEIHTDVWLNIAKNPLVDIIGHSGQERFRYDYEKVIPVFGEYGKVVEINARSAMVRPDTYENCRAIARLCKKHRVRVSVDSDAHFCYEIGQLDSALQVLEDVDFPEELIVNRTRDSVLQFLQERKKRLGQ